jgi:hypothetical protein
MSLFLIKKTPRGDGLQPVLGDRVERRIAAGAIGKRGRSRLAGHRKFTLLFKRIWSLTDKRKLSAGT